MEYFEIVETGPVAGFSARGYLGQYLVIDPKNRIVGVRMRIKRPGNDENPGPDGYYDFMDRVHALVR